MQTTTQEQILPTILSQEPLKEVNENLTIEEMDIILGSFSLDDDNHDQKQHNSNKQEEEESQQKQEIVYTAEEQVQENEIKEDQLSPNDVVLSKEKIVFGRLPLLPGTIEEVDFSVNLNFKQNQQNQPNSTNNQPHILRILAICKNQQFENLDEYVFSVRSNNYYEYYEEVRFKIRRGERADIKVAVKIPPVKSDYTINGVIQVRMENLQPIDIPIIAKCVLPEIVSLKTLYSEDEGTGVIKVPAKKGQLRTPPLPFKNLSQLNLAIEIQAIGAQDYSQKPYDIVLQNFVNAQANSLFYINMQLKENINYIQAFPSRMTIRKILILRVKNSSSIFHFPIEVSIFEGQVVQGN